jgi:hypothetical protein
LPALCRRRLPETVERDLIWERANRMEAAMARRSLFTSRPSKWPVTPEVAGSSPVAPALRVAASGDFLFGRALCRLRTMGCGWGGDRVEVLQHAAIRVREQVAVEVERDANRRLAHLRLQVLRMRSGGDQAA